LRRLCSNFKHRFYVYPQLTLGEIIVCTSGNGHSAINSKRVDFCIANQSFVPIAVIEYQGLGHFQNNAIIRDTIKQKAVQKAHIHYEPIYAEEINSIDSVLEVRLKPILENAGPKRF